MLAEPGVPQSFALPGNQLSEDFVIDRVGVVRGERVYVKEITWNGQRPPGNIVGLDGEKGGAFIRILVRGDGASATVKVADENGGSVPNAFVAMMPASATSEAEMSAAMIFKQTDQNGYCALGTVPPGRYYAVATDSLMDGTANRVHQGLEPDLAANLVSMLWTARRLGQVVDIGANARIEIKLERQTLR